MKRYVTPALQTFLLSGPRQFIVADCYTISLTTGQVYRFTSLDRNLTIAADAPINQPGGTFDSMGSRVKRGRLQNARGFQTSNLAITLGPDVSPDTSGGVLPSPPPQILGISLTEAAIGGLLYGATVRLETVYGDPLSGHGLTRQSDGTFNDGGWGSVIKFIGIVADVEVYRQEMTINAAAFSHLLEPYWPPMLIQSQCRWRLFDFGCSNQRSGTGSINSGSANLSVTGITLVAATDTGRPITVYGAGPSGGNLVTAIATVTGSNSATLAANASTSVSGAVVTIGLLAANFAVNGTVTTGSTPMFIFNNLTNPSGYFNQGRIVFTSGNNNGLMRTIRYNIGQGANSGYVQTVLNDNPYAFFRLNESVGASTVVDSSGNGFTGNVHGTVTFGEPSLIIGDTGTSALFDGSSGYISLNVPKPPNFRSGVSIEFLYTLTSGATSDQPNGIFDSAAAASNIYGTGIRNSGQQTDTLPGIEWNRDVPFVGFTAPAPASVQHMIAVFRGQNTIDLYINGNLWNSITAAGNGFYVWTDPFWIGRTIRPIGPVYFYFDGTLQDFTIYDYPLSSDQALTHYVAAITAPSTSPFGEFVLLTPLLFPPAAGDTFTAYPGCDKTQHTCEVKFNNELQFAGEPYIPQPEVGI